VVVEADSSAFPEVLPDRPFTAGQGFNYSARLCLKSTFSVVRAADHMKIAQRFSAGIVIEMSLEVREADG